ncbi:hypothetical protein NDU88_004156 [Pleurodeles waltl]|uniref:Uncharacterized protein n=1 Tax=Pleurodeles waltl TaxID=8319 RepID=A0AAV7NJ09_PLEWA|nr:hypothetical protein NDU88_004156 [Pleurodeles waltl]
MLYSPILINDEEFRSYYMTIYSEPPRAEVVILHRYLGGLHLRTLLEQDSEQLGAPVDGEENDLEAQDKCVNGDIDIVSAVSEFISEEFKAIEEKDWLDKDQRDLILQDVRRYLRHCIPQGKPQEIKEFFRINVGTGEKLVTVWKTFKVYIQVVTLSKHAGVLRSLCDRLARLETEISDLESQHRDMADSRLLGDIRTKLDEFHETA